MTLVQRKYLQQTLDINFSNIAVRVCKLIKNVEIQDGQQLRSNNWQTIGVRLDLSPI